MNKIVIKEKLGAVRLIIVFVITCFIIIIILSYYTMPHAFSDIYSKLFILIALFILLLICVPNLFFPTEILVIDYKGFFNYSLNDDMLSEYQGFIPWSNVSKVFLYTEEKNIVKKKKSKQVISKNRIKNKYKKIIIAYIILTVIMAITTAISMTIKDNWDLKVYIYSTLITPLVLIIFITVFVLKSDEQYELKKGKYIGIELKDINKVSPQEKQILIHSNIKKSKPMLAISCNDMKANPNEIILIMNRYII